MKKLYSLLVVFIAILLITGCTNSKVPKEFKGVLSNNTIYIANIGLGITDLKNSLITEGVKEKSIIEMDAFQEKTSFIKPQSIKTNSIVLLIINFDQTMMISKNTNREEEVERAKSFEAINNLCTVITIAIGHKEKYLNNNPYISFQEIETSLNLVNFSSLLIYIESQFPSANGQTIDTITMFEMLVKQKNETINFLSFKYFTQFDKEFIKYAV